MNPRKLVLKAAAVFLAAMTLFSSAASAESVNTAEVSRSYYASHGDYKVPLQVDETYQIKIKNAKEDIKYISNDDTIATVSDTGIITAKKPGTCKVRASYGTEIYWYKVTVSAFKYKIEDDKAIILKYCGNSKTVTVPQRLDDKLVTEIASKAFYKNTVVQTVKLPEDIIKLGKNVFYGCKKLKSVTYKGNSYTKKQLTALSKAIAAEGELTAAETPISDFEISEPKNGWNPSFTISVNKYKGYADKVIIPRRYNGCKVNSIAPHAFENNTELKSVTIPDTIAYINWRAFYGCIALEEVNFLGTNVGIGQQAFFDCESLKEITIPDGVKVIDWATFSGCISLKKVVLPESVKYIRESAFSDCFSLKDLYLPDDIERIDVEAFSGCKNLKLHYKGKVYNTSSKKDMNSLSYYNIVYKNGWRQVRK